MALSALLVVGSLIFAWEQQRLKQIADDKTIKAKVEEQRALESEAKAISLRNKMIPILNKNIEATFRLALSVLILENKDMVPEKLQPLKDLAIGAADVFDELFFTDQEVVEAAPMSTMETLYSMSMCDIATGRKESFYKRGIRLMEFSRRHPSDNPRQLIVSLDIRNHLDWHYSRIGKRHESVVWLKEGWEVCLDVPPETFAKSTQINNIMLWLADNYISALKELGPEAEAQKVSAEFDQLKQRLAQATAEKQE